jgi:hypothetical protein
VFGLVACALLEDGSVVIGHVGDVQALGLIARVSAIN